MTVKYALYKILTSADFVLYSVYCILFSRYFCTAIVCFEYKSQVIIRASIRGKLGITFILLYGVNTISAKILQFSQFAN